MIWVIEDQNYDSLWSFVQSRESTSGKGGSPKNWGSHSKIKHVMTSAQNNLRLKH